MEQKVQTQITSVSSFSFVVGRDAGFTDTDLSGQEWGKNIRNTPDKNPSNKQSYYPPDLYNQHGAKRNNCLWEPEHLSLREKGLKECNHPHSLLLPSEHFTLEIRKDLGDFPLITLKTFFF